MRYEFRPEDKGRLTEKEALTKASQLKQMAWLMITEEIEKQCSLIREGTTEIQTLRKERFKQGEGKNEIQDEALQIALEILPGLEKAQTLGSHLEQIPGADRFITPAIYTKVLEYLETLDKNSKDQLMERIKLAVMKKLLELKSYLEAKRK